MLIAVLLCFSKTLFAQTVGTVVKPTKEALLKYCGDYIPSEYDVMVGPMSIIMKEGKLYRRLEDDADRELIPAATNKFVYADGKRKLEFELNDKGKVVDVKLSRPDGEFIFKKTK